MKKLLFLFLISGGLFAQVIYPRKIYIAPDTIVGITTDQVKKLNLAFVQLDFQKSLADSFRVIIKEQTNTIKLQDINISSYKSDMKIKQNIIDNDLGIIKNYKLLDQSSQRKTKFLRLQRNVLAIAVAVAIVKIFL